MERSIHSSFFLLMMDSLIRVTSFFPGCSPCLRATLAATFFHPAVSFSLVNYCFFLRSFSKFSLFLSAFSSSFLSMNSSSCFRPRSLLYCFFSYSSFYVIWKAYRFVSQLLLDSFLLLSDPPTGLIVDLDIGL